MNAPAGSSYHHAFHCIWAEYLRQPGVQLTPERVQQLCGVDVEVCAQVLDDLVRARFLALGLERAYVRAAVARAHG